MSLKINTPTAKPPASGVDYESHLVKAVTAETTMGKYHKGKPIAPLVSVSEIVHPGVFLTAATACDVTVEGSRTVNLQDYNSARFGVSIRIPCDPEEVFNAAAWGEEFVSQRIDNALKDLKL